MHPILRKCFVHHFVVTLPAQVDALYFGLEGPWGSGFFMTLSTLLLTYRGMCISIDETLFIGAVRVVTGATVRIRYRIIHVVAHKRRFVSFMALHTENRRIIFQ